MKFMLQNKDKDLLGIYQCGYDPFCVSLLKPLSQLAHDHCKTLCDPAFWHSHDGSPTLHELSLPLHAIFPLACGRVWFLSMFEIQRRPCATLSIALGLTIVSTSIVQRCVYSQEWCTNFWGRKMIRMLRCECCATMRLLLDVWHVILQCCTTVARLLGTLPPIVLCKMFSRWFFANKNLIMTIRTLKFGDVTYNVMN